MLPRKKEVGDQRALSCRALRDVDEAIEGLQLIGPNHGSRFMSLRYPRC